nr:cytochrome-c peroxidase [Helicobacter sp. MIT 14-3879]
MGDELVKKALDSGLKPIPTGRELEKLTGLDGISKMQIELGKKLYFDPRISSSNLISCNTCHNLGLGGTDNIPAAIGNKWTMNPMLINSPTVYNSVFNSSQFWDGRSAHLKDQAKGPIQSSAEMNANPKIVIEKIISIPEYVIEFKKAYGNNVKIDFDLIADTIATFEKTLVTPSRYDDFLRGNTKALSKDEQEGLNIFIDKGCVACHNDINLGGTMQLLGVVKEYKFANVGGFKGNADGMVKTPTLRNILETMPYFHNGQYWDIKDAIKEMANIQLGDEISDEDSKKIAIFFESLTGKKPDILYPMLPTQTTNTPKPSF